MKTKRNMLTVVIAMAAIGLATGAQAATVSSNPTAPTVDGSDIALLDLTGVSGQGKFWAGEGFAAGQTFTTGSDPGGYLLKSATIRYSGGGEPTKTYGVRVVTLSGTTITELLDESAVHAATAQAGDYLTFELSSPFSLSPDTEYGFDVRMTASTSGWQSGIPTVSYVADSYAGGEYYTCSQWTDGNKGNWSATDLALAIPVASRDWIFHLDMTAAGGGAIPEPATMCALGMAIAGLGGYVRKRRRA